MANIGKIYIDSNDKYKKEESLAKVKEYFRQIGIIPILVDDTLKIYKIRVNKNLDNVINYFDKEYKYKFQRIKPKRKKDNYMYNLWQEVGTEIKNEKAATSDDIWKMFELENEVKRNEFYEKNARIIETDVVYNDEIWLKGYRKERLNEIVDRISKDCVVRTYEKSSKLAMFLKTFKAHNYNLDYIYKFIYEFYYNKDINFSTGINIIKENIETVINRDFNEVEKQLTQEEKIDCIKKMLEVFDVKCIFESKLSNMHNFLDGRIIDTDVLLSKEDVLDFAKHNYDIINNEEINEIVNKINGISTKRLKKKD